MARYDQALTVKKIIDVYNKVLPEVKATRSGSATESET